jgi:hypothetical protein
MHQQISETKDQPSQRRMSSTVAYSARIQEVMRYDKLRSAEYPLVMTILSAIAQGYTEEKWQEEQQRSLKALADQPSDKKAAHADATNLYEQLVSNLKDLTLWPW